MRTLAKNSSVLKYALQTGRTEIPEMVNGVAKTIIVDGVSVVVGSGVFDYTYSLPVSFTAPIALSGGEVEAEEFGLSTADYDAILVLEKGQIPLELTSLVWYESEPTYKDNEHTIVEPKSADYSVKAIKPTLSAVKVALKRVR